MYQKQLMSLQKTLSSLGIDFSIEKMDSETLACFPCERTRKEIGLYGYPSDFRMDTGSEGLSFYGVKQIKAGQTGYDDIKESLVIADESCDPIVINKDGSISWSIHGGAWEFQKIAETISQFFLMLEQFSLLFFGVYNGNICDKDFNIIAEKYDHIRDEITKIIKNETMADAFLKCILYQ